MEVPTHTEKSRVLCVRMPCAWCCSPVCSSSRRDPPLPPRATESSFGNKNRPDRDDFVLGSVSSTVPETCSVVSILPASVARGRRARSEVPRTTLCESHSVLDERKCEKGILPCFPLAGSIRSLLLGQSFESPTPVLGSWVGVRRLSHPSLFLTASRVVFYPKILVLTPSPPSPPGHERARRGFRVPGPHRRHPDPLLCACVL